ncbi:glycerophosphodiester phosphodiesterase family protein [Spirosoma telluris]|uniref:glycerophosphodiester phosphodiesterase family protein n=1 Tax=Spirosoma telluris TaxID=2183553 RepID=UPI002FC2899D
MKNSSLRKALKPLYVSGISGTVALMLIMCSPKTYTNTSKGHDFFNYKPNQDVKIQVHRGGGDLMGYPENCIESFAYMAKTIGRPNCPVVIECDIDLTKDSVMVMMHDATLDRTTTGTGKLNDKTYTDLGSCRLEDNLGNVTPYKIPTLEEILRWVKIKSSMRWMSNGMSPLRRSSI